MACNLHAIHFLRKRDLSPVSSLPVQNKFCRQATLNINAAFFFRFFFNGGNGSVKRSNSGIEYLLGLDKRGKEAGQEDVTAC